MLKEITATKGNLGKLLVGCVLVFAFQSANVLAAESTAPKKQKAVSVGNAYQVKSPDKKKKSSNKSKTDEAVEFFIAKSMGKKMNAIQWNFKASKIGRPILSGNQYQLINMAIEKGIKRQKRARAANLGFQDESSENYNMLVKRKAGNGQLRYGDLIALNLRPYGWIRYKDQGSYGGINLSDDNNNPHYIWRVIGGTHGSKVYSGMPFALYNTSPVKTEIIFCPRTSGIDLGWRGKSKCNSGWAKVSNKVFGANGALSGDGLTGKLATEWKDKLCTAGVASVTGAVIGTSGGTASVAAGAVSPIAVKKCNDL